MAKSPGTLRGEKRNITFLLKGIEKWQDFQEQKQKLSLRGFLIAASGNNSI